MIEQSETKPDPKFGEPALEVTLNNIKETLWNVEHNTQQTQSRLDKNNQSGPSHYAQKISNWSAERYVLDIMTETLVEIRDELEGSAIAKHSDSPLEKSIAKLQDSTVSFNEKTLRWHDDQTNLMVKGSDPRVATAMKASSKKTGWEALVAEHRKTRKLLGQGFFGKKSKGKSAEALSEGTAAEKNEAENEEKQTSFLSRLWENSKESKKGSWLSENWGKLLIGVGLLLAPLKHVVKLWEFMKTALAWSADHPLLAAILGLSAWFFGGSLVKLIGSAIISGIGSLFGASGAAGGMGLIGKLFLGVKAAALGGLASPLAIVGALAMAIFDGFTGLAMSGDWKVSKISGFLGGFFAGNKGWMGMFANMGKWAVAGAALGFPFGGIGAIPGGLVGAALGAIFNLIGGQRVAQAFDNLGGIFKKLFGPLWDGLKLFASDMFEWIIMKPVRWIKEKFMGSSFLDDFAKGWAEMKLQLKSVYDGVVQPFIDLFNWLINPENVITWDLVKDTFSKILAKLKGLIEEPIKSLKEFFFGGEAEAAVPEGQVTATSTAPKTSDERARSKSNISKLQELQKGEMWGTDSETEKYIDEMDVGDLRNAVQVAKVAGIDKSDKALYAYMVEALKKQTMSADDKEDTIMTKGEWTASDEFKKTFLNPETGKIEGASTAVQEMEYTNYVEGKRGTAGKDLSSDAESLSTSPTLVDTAKKVKVKKWVTHLEKKFKGATGRSKWTKKPILDKVRKQLRGPDREAILAALKGTELEKAVIKSAGGLKGPADLTGPAFEGMRTSTGGLDMASDAFTKRMSSAQSPDDKMNTFNSVQKENLAAQNQPSSPVVISQVDGSQKTLVAPKVTEVYPTDTMHDAPVPVGVSQ